MNITNKLQIPTPLERHPNLSTRCILQPSAQSPTPGLLCVRSIKYLRINLEVDERTDRLCVQYFLFPIRKSGIDLLYSADH